eukprot:CAMPEP_0114974330 /NCGR_PEP_ID=MMETSP0216-20121206/1459_1 /TAXON_ID=223996 /ORGANISM="Protocruzia adherens, Strain Boccale" /LENGTH=127 /DNA_ID=CAMNT_0002334939 /DNA_START=583 /DNA_END=963 /DNA_ORIENTATION=-
MGVGVLITGSGVSVMDSSVQRMSNTPVAIGLDTRRWTLWLLLIGLCVSVVVFSGVSLVVVKGSLSVGLCFEKSGIAGLEREPRFGLKTVAPPVLLARVRLERKLVASLERLKPREFREGEINGSTEW